MKEVYSLPIMFRDGPGYSFKYSDEGDKIGISVPGMRVDVLKTDMTLPRDFRNELKNRGFSDKFIDNLSEFFFTGKCFNESSIAQSIDEKSGKIRYLS